MMSTDSGTAFHVIELIPGEDVLVIASGDSDLPDEDAVAELRMQAYERRDEATLGTSISSALQTLAEFLVAGVIGNAAWAPFPAAVRYAREWQRRRKAATPILAEQAIARARQVCRVAFGKALPELHTDSVHPLIGDEGWRVTLRQDTQTVHVEMDSAGVICSVWRYRAMADSAADQGGEVRQFRPDGGIGQ
jgi:hypothetical protein